MKKIKALYVAMIETGTEVKITGHESRWAGIASRVYGSDAVGGFDPQGVRQAFDIPQHFLIS